MSVIARVYQTDSDRAQPLLRIHAFLDEIHQRTQTGLEKLDADRDGGSWLEYSLTVLSPILGLAKAASEANSGARFGRKDLITDLANGKEALEGPLFIYEEALILQQLPYANCQQLLSDFAHGLERTLSVQDPSLKTQRRSYTDLDVRDIQARFQEEDPAYPLNVLDCMPPASNNLVPFFVRGRDFGLLGTICANTGREKEKKEEAKAAPSTATSPQTRAKAKSAQKKAKERQKNRNLHGGRPDVGGAVTDPEKFTLMANARLLRHRTWMSTVYDTFPRAQKLQLGSAGSIVQRDQFSKPGKTTHNCHQREQNGCSSCCTKVK